MKILIISLPRTGSNFLMKKYSTEYNLEMIGEPFNPINNKTNIDLENSDNIVVKTIINQIPNNEINPIDFYNNFSKKFDKTILLSRKDKKQCAESLAFLNYNEKNGFKYNDEYTWHWTPNIEESKKFIKNCDDLLSNLSNILKIDIIYYEDIFDLNSQNRLRKGNIKPNKII